MTHFDPQAAAAELINRRLTGHSGARLSEGCRPTTFDQALTIQAAVSSSWCDIQDDSIGGWKCLLPIGDKRILGPIYTSTINTVAPIALWPTGGIARIEPELAFFFHHDLPPRAQAYTPAEVDAAVARTHMALELIHCRYKDPSECEFPEMLADGLVNQGLFIGPEVDSQTAANASEIAINVSHLSQSHAFQGKHPNVNPRAPLYWLVEFLRQHQQGILAGQAVITGSYAGVIEVPLNTDITVDYAGLGQMQVHFTAKESN